MTIKKRRVLKTKRQLPKLELGGDPTSMSNLASIFGSLNGISTTDPNELRPTNNPGGKSGGGLNMSFDPVSMGLSTLTAIGGALGANMATKKAEMYADASDNLQMLDVNKITKGSGLQSFLQNPLSLGIGGRKKAELEAEEFNENMAKQLRNRNVASRFSTMSDAPTYTPVARQGGFIAYKGQTHEGSDGGILVDKFGNPTAISQEESVASVEGGGKHKKGEVSYYDPESGSTYIYSDSLKFAKPANSLLNKYKLTKPESLQYQQYKNDLLTQTMVKKKFENLTIAQEFAKETGSLAKDSMGIFKNGGGLSSSKAKEMLKDGTAHGKKLTAKQKRYFGWIAGGRKQDGGELDYTGMGIKFMQNNPIEIKKQSLVPGLYPMGDKRNYELLFNAIKKQNTSNIFDMLPQSIDDNSRPTPLGSTETIQEYIKGLPKADRKTIQKNKKEDKIYIDYLINRYKSQVNPYGTYEGGGTLPIYEKGGEIKKKPYKDRSTGFIEDINEFIFDPISAAFGLPSTKSIKGLGYDVIPGVGGATFGLRTFGKSNTQTQEVPQTKAVSRYEVPNLEINPTQIPGVTFPSAPKLNMSSGFANVSGLYDRKTPNARSGYYNDGFTRPYSFGNMEPQGKKPIISSGTSGGSATPPTTTTPPNTGMSPGFFERYARGIRDRQIGPQATTPISTPTGMTNGMQEEDYNSWLNPAGHMLSAAGAMADYAAMKKARPEDVSLGRVGAERISLARQRLSNTRNTASARAMASSAARSSGMNAGVVLSNTLAANTGANRLLGQQNAELLEREESANAQMRQQANMINAELAAQEGLFNTQQQNAYRMMMAQNNPLGNLARTTASYFADNAAYQQGYDTLQMLAPNAELYRDPNAKWKNNPFARPKVRLR